MMEGRKYTKEFAQTIKWPAKPTIAHERPHGLSLRTEASGSFPKPTLPLPTVGTMLWTTGTAGLRPPGTAPAQRKPCLEPAEGQPLWEPVPADVQNIHTALCTRLGAGRARFRAISFFQPGLFKLIAGHLSTLILLVPAPSCASRPLHPAQLLVPL